MKKITDTNLKIGDRVKWSGTYWKAINGYTKKSIIDYVKTKRLEGGFDFEKWFNENTVPCKRKGINKIKHIQYNHLFEEVVIILGNGKIFTDDNMLIKIN